MILKITFQTSNRIFDASNVTFYRSTIQFQVWIRAGFPQAFALAVAGVLCENTPATHEIQGGRFRSMIETHQLTKVFRDRKNRTARAVDGVNLRCAPGQIYGLLGANGAGKTTTLRLLATLLKPSSGTALVAGCDAVREPEKVRARIGFLSTGTALYGRLTARETVEYFGRLQGVAESVIQQRIHEIFSKLVMDEFRDRRCDKLSTGMKQKVSIARTLIHDPPVMIFDEPTLGLDVMTARTIVQFIRECRQQGKTVIVSTHVMSEVEKLCDRIGIIHGGRLLVEGTLAELRTQFGLSDLEDIFVKVVEGPA
jgi:sodium transport system ATP-binding protein